MEKLKLFEDYLTESKADKIKKIISQIGNDDVSLRAEVYGNGLNKYIFYNNNIQFQLMIDKMTYVRLKKDFNLGNYDRETKNSDFKQMLDYLLKNNLQFDVVLLNKI